MKISLAALLLTFPLVAAPAERRLVPVFYDQHAASTTGWATSVLVNNGTAQPIVTPGVSWLVTCSIPEGCIQDSLPAALSGFVEAPFAPHGLLLTVPAADAGGAAVFTVFVSAASHSDCAELTPLPVVRESDFTSSRLDLPAIVSSQASRARLRIYALDVDDADVRVDVSPWYVPGLNTYSVQVHLTRPADVVSPPRFPAYAELDLTEASRRLGTYISVHVTPLVSGRSTPPRMWAFATNTVNATNAVTIYTPD